MGERSVRSSGQCAGSKGSEGGKMNFARLLSDLGGNYAILEDKGDKYSTFVRFLR